MFLGCPVYMSFRSQIGPQQSGRQDDCLLDAKVVDANLSLLAVNVRVALNFDALLSDANVLVAAI